MGRMVALEWQGGWGVVLCVALVLARPQTVAVILQLRNGKKLYRDIVIALYTQNKKFVDYRKECLLDL